jgi:catechol 2,3-dioxygenase-like lactoylglutathione lyase family enzyme
MSLGGRLQHIGVSIADMDQALGFLSRLGFETRARFEPFDPDAVAGITRLTGAKVRQIAYVARDDYSFELLEYVAPPSDQGARRVCDIGYFHFALEVDDLAEVMAALGSDAKPYTVAQGPAKGQSAAYVYGPDGLTVELIERPRKP